MGGCGVAGDGAARRVVGAVAGGGTRRARTAAPGPAPGPAPQLVGLFAKGWVKHCYSIAFVPDRFNRCPSYHLWEVCHAKGSKGCAGCAAPRGAPWRRLCPAALPFPHGAALAPRRRCSD